MPQSQLFFSPAINWFVLGAAVVLVFGLLFYSYANLSKTLRGNLPLVFGILKIAVLLLVMLCLVQPVVSMEKRLRGQGVVAVLLDTSKSMEVEDSLGGRSRFDASVGLLGSEGRLLKSLAADYTVRLFRFDESLEAIEQTDLPKLKENLRSHTSIFGSLAKLAKSGEARSLTAVVVISDGRETGGLSDSSPAAALGVPIYTVGVGSDYTRAGLVNLAILSLDAPKTVYLNNAVSFSASIGAFNTPSGNRFARLTLLLDDRKITEKDFRMPEPNTIARVNLDFTPDRLGLQKYTLQLSPLSEETILADNTREIYMDVREPRLRLLYVEGLLRPEYGFIRRTLTTDPDVKITSLVRTRTDNFLLQGEAVSVDISRGLPDKPEDFKEFDIIILGDIAASAFREYQLKYLREWVEGGGGLMMLGGYSCFNPGGWRDTPIAQVLPVMMSAEDPQIAMPLLVEVTAAGRTHPIMKGITEFESDAIQKGKGALGGCTGTAGPRSGAQVLAYGKDSRGKSYILCAAQKFGKGRSFAFTADTTGKAHRELVGFGIPSPYEKFWGQAVRWLAGFDELRKQKEVYLQISLESRFVEVAEPITISTEVKDPNKTLTEVPSVALTVKTPSGEEIKLAHSIDNKTLAGSASYTPAASGLYNIIGRLSTKGGAELDTTDYAFLVGKPWLENANLALDEPSLKELARMTGGKYYTVASAARLPVDIATTREKGVERVTLSLWNNPWVLALLLGLLCFEWFLRRRNQLL